MIGCLTTRKYANEILAQLIREFGDNPGFFDELIDTLHATSTGEERAEAIRRLSQKWGYPEEDVFRALVPASWLANQGTHAAPSQRPA